MTDQSIEPTTIVRHANAVFGPMAMLAAMELDLFSALGDGPATAAEIAAAIDADPERLVLLLYALVSAEMLTVEDGVFANTAEADRYLISGKPGYMGGLSSLYRELWDAGMQTAATFREGRPMAKHDYAAMDAAALGEFYAGTHPGALGAARQLAARVDISGCRRLLDAAGGSGGLGIGLCQAHPELTATIADLPSVAPIARRFVEQAGLSDRITVEPVDLTERRPPGSYDAAVLRNLIQVLSADDAARAIGNIGQAVEPGGVLCIFGWVMDDSRATPPNAVSHNLVFINFYDHGQAHTEGEHRAWLEAAGFTDIVRQAMPGDYGLISARKA
jgi:hypothetical protein